MAYVTETLRQAALRCPIPERPPVAADSADGRMQDEPVHEPAGAEGESSNAALARAFVPGSHAEAKWAYESGNHTMSSGDKDLSVAKGERMHVHSLLADGAWARVTTLDLETGVVPTSHLGVLKYLQATYRYAPSGFTMSSGDIDLGLSKGDVLLLVAELPRDWVRVQKDSGEVGIVPGSYCEPLDPPYDFPPPDAAALADDAEFRATRRRTMMLTNRKLGGGLSSAGAAAAEGRPTKGGQAKNTSVIQEGRSSRSTSIENSFAANTAPPKAGTLPKVTSETNSLKQLDSPTPARTQSESSISATHKQVSGTQKKLLTASGSMSRSGSLGLSGGAADPLAGKKLHQAPVWPDDYPFSQRDSPLNLLFMDDLVDGYPQVKAGTLTKLIERLTLPDYVDPKFTPDTLLTYRSFATPSELLDVLIRRFQVPDPPLNLGTQAPPSLAESELEEQLAIYFRTVLKPIQLRVFNVIKKWVEDYYYDWAENPTLIERLRVFMAEDLRIAGMDTAVKSLTRVLEKRDGQQTTVATKDHSDRKNADRKNDDDDDGWYEDAYTHSEDSPASFAPDIKELAKAPANAQMFVFHPEEIARQVSLIDHNLFRRIRPWECLGQKWTKPHLQQHTPHIMASIKRFNSFSLLVASTVVQIADKQKRAKMIEFWIDVAARLKILHNYNATMAVLAGLRNAAVHRLSKTWKAVNSKVRKQFEGLISDMSPEHNYRTYRAALKAASPPCVPYLGVYLTDLTFIEDGNPDELDASIRKRTAQQQGDGPSGVKLINFDKRRRLSHVIQDIRTYQLTRYNFKEVPVIQGAVLAGGEFVDENKMYELSLQIEPRQGSSQNSKEWKNSIKDRKGIHRMAVYNVSSVPSPVSSPRVSVNSAVTTDSVPPATTSSPAEVIVPPESRTTASLQDLQTVEDASMDDLVQLLSQGYETEVDAYLAQRQMTQEERNLMKEQAERLCKLQSRKQTAQRVDDSFLKPNAVVREDQAEVFERCLTWLLAGDHASFEEYLAGLGVFQAQRVRDQALKMLEATMAARHNQ